MLQTLLSVKDYGLHYMFCISFANHADRSGNSSRKKKLASRREAEYLAAKLDWSFEAP